MRVSVMWRVQVERVNTEVAEAIERAASACPPPNAADVAAAELAAEAAAGLTTPSSPRLDASLVLRCGHVETDSSLCAACV